MYLKLMTFFREVIFKSLIRMILRQKACNKILFLVRKLKHDCSCRAKKLALTF